MLNVTNLIKDYSTGFIKKTVRVLDGVSFAVNDGEIYGYVGPNGAGKTTTFKCILGFVSTTEGTIEVMDRSIEDVTVKNRVGYLPENPYFYDYLTGEELLRYMGELHGMESTALSKRIDELLEKVNMTHARKIQLRKYSKGMLQRVGVAQALINDPELLILDEPMSGLDPIGRREIKDLILEQKAKGKTILLSSHMLADVEALCDRVGVIMHGKVVSEGIIGDLLEEIHTDYEMLIKANEAELKQKVANLTVDIENRGEMLVLKFDEDLKPQVMNALNDLEVDIVSLSPLRRSLEGYFVEEAKKENIQ